MPVSVRVDKVPSAVLSVLSGPGATTGKGLVSHPLIRKVDITVQIVTGRVLGSIVGGNFAAFTAELGGKTCVSGIRLPVQFDVYDAFVSQFLDKARSITSLVEERSSGSIPVGGEPLKDRPPLDGFNFSRGSFYPPDDNRRRILG
ncbi:hypothetical protein V8E52_000073 [Russula decolorans]